MTDKDYKIEWEELVQSLVHLGDRHCWRYKNCRVEDELDLKWRVHILQTEVNAGRARRLTVSVRDCAPWRPWPGQPVVVDKRNSELIITPVNCNSAND